MLTALRGAGGVHEGDKKPNVPALVKFVNYQGLRLSLAEMLMFIDAIQEVPDFVMALIVILGILALVRN